MKPARKRRVGLVMHDCFLSTQTQLCTHLIISNRILFESHAVMRENVHYAQFMFCISELARGNSKEAKKNGGGGEKSSLPLLLSLRL